jgi:hypothetical protein
MRHWNRTVLIGNGEMGEYLRDEIRRRWPEAQYPFHIEVVSDQSMTHLEVRVWNIGGVQIVKGVLPEQSMASGTQSPTVVAALQTVEAAISEACRMAQEKRGDDADSNPAKA